MPFNVKISPEVSLNGQFILSDNTKIWIPTGKGSNVNGKFVQDFLNAGYNVTIRTSEDVGTGEGVGTEPGNIIYNFNTFLNNHATLTLQADNDINLARDIIGSNLTLRLIGANAFGGGEDAGIKVKALLIETERECNIGDPRGFNKTELSVDGKTDGSNIQFPNTIKKGTHLVNGLDLYSYLVASNTASAMTAAFDASASSSKTDKDKLEKDKHDSSASKFKK